MGGLFFPVHEANMALLGELRLPAHPKSLRVISHFVRGIAHRLSLSDKALFDLELAVEEAATNIINHAYPDDQPGEIVIRADELDQLVRITLMDWGVPLDPADVKPFDINAPVETRIKGGMGLHFMPTIFISLKKMASSGCNLKLTLKVSTKKSQPIVVSV